MWGRGLAAFLALLAIGGILSSIPSLVGASKALARSDFKILLDRNFLSLACVLGFDLCILIASAVLMRWWRTALALVLLTAMALLSLGRILAQPELLGA